MTCVLASQCTLSRLKCRYMDRDGRRRSCVPGLWMGSLADGRVGPRTHLKWITINKASPALVMVVALDQTTVGSTYRQQSALRSDISESS